MTSPMLKEILCGRLPAVLVSPDLRHTLAFYRDEWGFKVQHHITSVIAVLKRESVSIQLWQLRADMQPQSWACRLLVNCLGQWQTTLQSAPGQSRARLMQRGWGAEWGLSHCDGNRLLLVQSAPHAARREAGL